MVGDEGGRHRPGPERRVSQHGTVEGDRGRDATDPELCQRPLHPRDGLVAVPPPGHQFGDQRVIGRQDRRAHFHRAVNPDPGAAWFSVGGERAGAGSKPAPGVLGVDPALDRVPSWTRIRRVKREGIAGCDPNLLLDQVDPGHGLRHRVLNLDPGVHLKEVKRAVRIQQKLDGARPTVINRSG